MVDTNFQLVIRQEEIIFSPLKVAFWPKEKTLFIADCHLGKVAHFRKSGIGIPAEAGNDTFHLMQKAMKEYQPQRVIFLGDLFHSEINPDFERFIIWKSNFQQVDFHLVRGNHDKASGPHLEKLEIGLHARLEMGPFVCTHHPEFDLVDGFNFSGHIHPAIHLSGIAHQSATCPCFWIGNNFLVFPAFGAFTGLAKIKPLPGDTVLAIAGSKIFGFGNVGRMA